MDHCEGRRILDMNIERDEQHRYFLNGRAAVGVTSVMKGAMRFAGAPEHLIVAAGERGTRTHQAVEIINQGKRLDPTSIHASIANRIKAYYLFLSETGFVPSMVEELVGHEDYLYCGQLDTAGSFRKIKVPGADLDLIDIKTSASVPFTVAQQTAGYAGALYHARKVERANRWCVHLRSDATYRLIPLRAAFDWSSFLSMLNVYRVCHDHRIEL